MRKVVIFLLVAAMCFAMTACSLIPEPDVTEAPHTPDVYEPPEADDAIKAYLSSRYEGEFEHVHYEKDQDILYYKSTAYNGLIKVYHKDSLWLDGYDISLYEGDYADNGYYLVAYKDAYKYYWSYFEYIPDITMLMHLSGDVLPSSLTAEDQFINVKAMHPEYFHPVIYILREKTFETAELTALKDYLAAGKESATVYVVIAPRAEWNNINLDDLQANPNDYNIRQSFTVTPEDSGV